MSWSEKIQENLENAKEKNFFRELKQFDLRAKNIINSDNSRYINFSSNDYLSLSSNLEIKNETEEINAKQELFSCASSRLITGNHEGYYHLENDMAEWKSSESALIFNSGYTANIGIMQSLSLLKPIFFSDKLVHASLIDGLRLADSEIRRFRHNDLNHLKTLIELEPEDKLKCIVVDALYSMDGDLCDIDSLIEIKRRYKNVILFLDEAHSGGVFGMEGKGLSSGKENEIDLVLGTFSKAFASFGAYLVCSKLWKSYFVNNCRSFIFTSALPLMLIARNMATLNYLKKHKTLGERLLKKSEEFRLELKQLTVDIGNSQSQIIPMICGSSERAMNAMQMFSEKGYWCHAIRYPTVAENMARIRLSINLDHNDYDLEKCLSLIRKHREFFA